MQAGLGPVDRSEPLRRTVAMEAEIARRRCQQAALAELGQAGLTGVEPAMILGQTCALVESVVGGTRCSIVERENDGGWTLRFAVGVNTTFDRCRDADPSHHALFDYALMASDAVVFDNLAADPRFDGMHWLAAHSVESGVSLVVHGRSRPVGVLTLVNNERRRFAGDEIEFLKSISDLAGAIVESARSDDARRAAERDRAQSEERFRALVENSGEGIAIVDSEGTFVYVSPATERLLGFTDAELLGTNFAALVHDDDLGYARGRFRELRATDGHEVRGELRLRNERGGYRWIEGTYRNLLLDPSVRGIVINYRDVTERKIAEQQLERLAYRDTLTDLPNRFLFQDRVQHALEQARRRGRGMAVMYVDLDRFKVVNDTLGHATGDRLLQVVATRLRDVLRVDDTIARLGGDEFAILLPDVDRGEDAGNIGRKLLASLREPVRVDGHDLHATASIGIALYPTDGEDLGALLKNADAALYRAKELGRNGVQLFATSMNARYRERLELELSLHRALELDELELHYQPICDRSGRNIRMFEALLRWRRPGRGLVNPAEFIKLAEETRLIIPIGDWVLRSACAQLRAWRDAGLDGFRIAVNLSAHQIAQPTFIHSVHDALLAHGLQPADLELEITESAALQNLEWTLSVLDQLKSLGVAIAVDDFGTGQSSLAYLKRLPLQTVKIDREFLRDITNEADAAILRSIIQLGHSLGLYVTVEGIETESDRHLVEQHGADGLQGYLFSRPMAAGAVPPYLAGFRYPVPASAA
jgi:diguanylate cyclase (GGDEF)-like protein/PAS domain S-box-containing protein